MIGLDTNVLIRLLIGDDPAQTARAQEILKRAHTAQESLYLDAIVLAEAVWVLRRVYRATRADIASTLRALLDSVAYEIGDRPEVEVALARYLAGNADFADCLIAARSIAAGCRHTVTFDEDASGIEGMQAI